jgi:peptidoglycan biosynthesis protein MviN/MurJ (putative lipid II flippase)
VFLDFPAVGVWLAIFVGHFLRRTHWPVLEHPFKGSIFLLSLVMAASMMPVDRLPDPSWVSALSLGFVSAVFDNIPLTKLALDQGGYDWDCLAYAVGFGGSMIWFGSSAGVAVSNIFPQAKSVAHWLRHGWHVALAYVIGFFVMLAATGWEPHEPHRDGEPAGAHAAAKPPPVTGNP